MIGPVLGGLRFGESRECGDTEGDCEPDAQLQVHGGHFLFRERGERGHDGRSRDEGDLAGFGHHLFGGVRGEGRFGDDGGAAGLDRRLGAHGERGGVDNGEHVCVCVCVCRRERGVGWGTLGFHQDQSSSPLRLDGNG